MYECLVMSSTGAYVPLDTTSFLDGDSVLSDVSGLNDLTEIHDGLADIQVLLSVLVVAVGILIGVSLGKAFSFWKW